MSPRSRTIVTLSWTVLSLALTALVSSEGPTKEKVKSSGDSGLLSGDSGSARKYLELKDLNGFEPRFASNLASGEELISEIHGGNLKHANPQKLVRRSAGTTPRVTRQAQKKPRPGFFWTLARVTFETFNDTKSAIQQIGQIINESIPPGPPKKPGKKPITPGKPAGLAKATATATGKGQSLEPTTAAPTTTTEAEIILTRPLLQSLIRRNVKGLVRLFNIEWRDALNQSQRNVQEFRRDLGKQVSFYLKDNPDNY